jgi:hypothetical protein
LFAVPKARITLDELDQYSALALPIEVDIARSVRLSNAEIRLLRLEEVIEIVVKGIAGVTRTPYEVAM